MRSSQPADLQQALRDSSDTVTDMLELLAGEKIVADVVRRCAVSAVTGNALGVAPGQPLTHRIAVLKGVTSEQPYLYAESTFVPERLPQSAGLQLTRSSEPIGRVVVAHGFRLSREELPGPELPELPPATAAGDDTTEVVWARAYLLLLDDRPVFAIREWFFRSVLDVLDRARPV
jgi:chorismate-pyruvate lyase